MEMAGSSVGVTGRAQPPHRVGKQAEHIGGSQAQQSGKHLPLQHALRDRRSRQSG